MPQSRISILFWQRFQFLAPPLPFGKMQSSTSWVLHLLTPFFSSAFALWANAELYILGPSLTPFLPSFLPFSGRKLKISDNIDAKTLKFCIFYIQTASSRLTLLPLSITNLLTCLLAYFGSNLKETQLNLVISMIGLLYLVCGIQRQ